MYSNKNFYIYYNFVILHFNYLPFTYSYSQGYYNFLSGQYSSEVKSYILRKKKCMLMFYCALIFILSTWSLSLPWSFGIVFEHISLSLLNLS